MSGVLDVDSAPTKVLVAVIRAVFEKGERCLFNEQREGGKEIGQVVTSKLRLQQLLLKVKLGIDGAMVEDEEILFLLRSELSGVTTFLFVTEFLEAGLIMPC